MITVILPATKESMTVAKIDGRLYEWAASPRGNEIRDAIDAEPEGVFSLLFAL